MHASGGEETITLRLPIHKAPRVFTLERPDRLVVDVETLTKERRTSLQISPGYRSLYVQGIRSAQFDAHTTRIVFSLRNPLGKIRTETKRRGNDLLITLHLRGSHVAAIPTLKTPQTQKKTPEEDAQRVTAPSSLPPIKRDTQRAAPEPQASNLEKKSPPADNDSRPLIVIDPGHGGPDPGTASPEGTQEKELVLEYGKALKRALEASGRFRVYMTRGDDHFVLLHQRVELARKAHGALFVSLHANSAPQDDIHGLSVYTLSEEASDAETAALANRENKADAVYDLDLSAQSKDVADILYSLAQRDTNSHSMRLGDYLVSALERRGVDLLSTRTHRFAGFAVLKAPDIPSVLVEIGFLSNEAEERRLKTKAYREKVVTGLTAGIESYFAKQQEAKK